MAKGHPVPTARAMQPWAQIEDDILRRFYPRASTEQLCAALPGRSFAAMQRRAVALKIHRWRPESRGNRRVVHSVLAQLRAVREERGISRPELQKRSGYHVNQLLHWELGQTQPTFATVVDWAATLGFDLVLRERKAEDDVIRFPEKRQLMAGR